MSNIFYKILITFLQKLHFFRNKFLQKIQSDISTKNSKIIKYQQQQPHLPFTMHRLPQDHRKMIKIVNFDQEEFTCNFTLPPKVTITYSGNPPPTNNALIYTPMQNQNTLICLAGQTTTQWITLDQKSSQATHSMFETSKKREKTTSGMSV